MNDYHIGANGYERRINNFLWPFGFLSWFSTVISAEISSFRWYGNDSCIGDMQVDKIKEKSTLRQFETLYELRMSYFAEGHGWRPKDRILVSYALKLTFIVYFCIIQPTSALIIFKKVNSILICSLEVLFFVPEHYLCMYNIIPSK